MSNIDSGRMRLEAARLASATLFALLLRQGLTRGIAVYSGVPLVSSGSEALLLLFTGLSITALLSRRSYALFAASSVTALNIGMLFPVLFRGPVIVSLTLLWLSTLIARWILPRPRPRIIPSHDHERVWFRNYGRSIRHLVFAALLAQIVVFAMRFGEYSQAGLIARFWAVSAFLSMIPWLFRQVEKLKRSSRLILVLGILGILSFPWPQLSAGLFSVSLLGILLLLGSKAPLADEIIRHILSRPAILTCLSFFLVIAVGTFLLALPAASAMPEALTPSAALFTATSATCVTGLIVVDTGHDLSLFGKIVVLFLMQIGGLSIMVLSGFATMVVGARMGLRGAHALSSALDQTTTRSARKLAGFVVLSTLSLELIGTILLSIGESSKGGGLGSALWHGAFHSVSAFCNAGFSLNSESLIGASPLVLMTVAGLITAGGLGFPVLAAGWARLRKEKSPVSTLQLRLVLSWSAGLVILGTLWVLIFEWRGALEGLSPFSKFLNALFQSVTLRTAGFNSIPMASLGSGTLLLMLLLMVIGASPGGTGGGLKTTTVAVLMGAVPAAAAGRPRVILRRHSIPMETLFRCAAIATLGLGALLLGSLALMISQDQSFVSLLFECVSALGTVGLSLGATSHLDLAGRLIIVVLMFVGRVGPLSAALLLTRRASGRVEYPETRLMVG